MRSMFKTIVVKQIWKFSYYFSDFSTISHNGFLRQRNGRRTRFIRRKATPNEDEFHRLATRRVGKCVRSNHCRSYDNTEITKFRPAIIRMSSCEKLWQWSLIFSKAEFRYIFFRNSIFLEAIIIPVPWKLYSLCIWYLIPFFEKKTHNVTVLLLETSIQEFYVLRHLLHSLKLTFHNSEYSLICNNEVATTI